MLPLMGCRQDGATGRAEGLTPLSPATGPEASSMKPLCQGFTSVPWRAVQQPPFTWWWCPVGPGRRALAGWVITMVPGSARFSLVAPGGRDCYFTLPPRPHLQKLKLAEVANLGGGPTATKWGQAQLEPKPRVPVPLGAPQSPNPKGQRQPCLTAWAFIHSP